jgi:hypothetical protein
MNPIGPMLALEARGPVSYLPTRPERSGSGRGEAREECGSHLDSPAHSGDARPLLGERC